MSIKIDRSVQIAQTRISLGDLKELVEAAYANGLTSAATVTPSTYTTGGDWRDNTPSRTTYTIKVSA